MTADTPLVAHDEIVDDLRRVLSSTEHGLGTVPNIVKVVVRREAWRDRVIRATGQRVTFSSFTEFVTTAPLEGLGATLDQLRGVCRSDPEALDAIEVAIGSRQGERTDLVDISNEVERPTGTTKAQALRRLRKDRPDLHAEVLAGNVSPHAAMVKAGFRPKTWTAPTSVDGLATALRRRLSDDERQRLAVLLVDVEA